MKLESFKINRFASNPVEKQLHDSFIKNHSTDKDMGFIIFGPADSNSTYPADYLSDREKQIVLSTVQWMGSPVGQHFLQENGFKYDKIYRRSISNFTYLVTKELKTSYLKQIFRFLKLIPKREEFEIDESVNYEVGIVIKTTERHVFTYEQVKILNKFDNRTA